MDLSVPYISYKWNCTTCSLLHLAALTEYNVFKVHPCRSGTSVLHSFLWWNNFLSYGYSTFCFIHSLVYRHVSARKLFGLFLHFGSWNTLMCTFLCGYKFLGYIPRNGNTESWVNSTFYTLRTYQFSKELYHFTFPPAIYEVPVSPYSCQYLLSSIFFDKSLFMWDVWWYRGFTLVWWKFPEWIVVVG